MFKPIIPKVVLDYCQARPGCKDCNICDDKPVKADKYWLEQKIKQVVSYQGLRTAPEWRKELGVGLSHPWRFSDFELKYQRISKEEFLLRAEHGSSNHNANP